jgi:hypothetical protein
MRLSRTTGVFAGIVLFVLGLWGALIPFVGPYFNYGFSPDTTWHFTMNRFWLCILPGAATAIGGLVLMFASRRSTGLAGGSLALAGGVWFVVGSSVSLLWASHSGTVLLSGVGTPLGGHDRAAAEAIGFFYGLGALITLLSAFALARFAMLPAAAGVRARERGVVARSPGVAPVAGAPLARMPEREGATPAQGEPVGERATERAAATPSEVAR